MLNLIDRREIKVNLLGAIASGIVVIALSVFLGVKHYVISRDLTSYLIRAQVSAHAEDMLEYMKKLRAGMEEYRMTAGYNAIIFKKPENDLSLIYRAVCRIIERLEEVRKMDISSIEYQTALDDIRGVTRELDIQAFGWWYSNKRGWILGWVIGISCCFMFFFIIKIAKIKGVM